MPEILPFPPSQHAKQPETLIEARSLCYEATDQTLIRDVSIKVPQGRRTVLIGANGSGKSLLLRLLHGLLPPATGDILWRGRPLDRAARDAQAMVFQKPILLRRSVAANLRFALSVRGVSGRECRRRVDEALELARLGHLAHRPARVLSGGEQQRLSIARALSLNPDLLLLDEPTANLDPAATLMIEEQINHANARGVSILMVTHDAGQARRMADYIAFLHNGQLVETGLADTVLNNPTSPAAKAWLSGRLYTGAP
jgi:tungstate transport system ATP-binding protein